MNNEIDVGQLDSFLADVKKIIETISKSKQVFDYGIHYTRKPYIYSDYVLCLECDYMDGKTLDEVSSLGYEITMMEAIREDDDAKANNHHIRIFFKRK